MSVRQRKTRGPGLPPEATLFHQAQKGNRLALNQLVVRHDGLVHAIIRRHGSESLFYAETLQAGNYLFVWCRYWPKQRPLAPTIQWLP